MEQDGQTGAAPDTGGSDIEGQDTGYRVLARKYRPQRFSDLVGQDAMVRILSAAFETGRIAHAFMLTGVRGVGKTTTARLIARALNYTDSEGRSTPSLDFSAPGAHCQAIQASRHMDVLEMDAASRTGIDDIREIIEGAKFKPASAPYKVYIIDEVHMLSKAAFNGLLKILEEPPGHVKFIFATTEVRKVPVTVLSRCQRFDLRRIEPSVMVPHLAAVAEKEKITIETPALNLIARGSEGSMRDALSLLDQAIVHGGTSGAPISDDAVREMMGLADRERILDLFDHLMAGNIADALSELRAQYDLGADPLEVLRDLLDICHWLTELNVTKGAGSDAQMSEAQQARGREMAGKLSVGALAKVWQILLKGLGEAQNAPRPMAATEMVLVRLAYAADLPSPEDLVRQLSAEAETGGAPKGAAPASGGSGASAIRSLETKSSAQMTPSGARPPQAMASQSAAAPALEASKEPWRRLETYEQVLGLLTEVRDIRLLTEIEDHVHLVSFAPASIEMRLTADAPDDLAGRLAARLKALTGERWMVSLSNEAGKETISEQKKRQREERDKELRQTPLVKAALEIFPEAKIIDVRERKIPAFDGTEEFFSSEGEGGFDDDDNDHLEF